MERERNGRRSGGLSRRGLLATGAAGALFRVIGPAVRASGPGAAEEDLGAGLIVRNDRPLDAETPVELLGTYLTPNPAFFVRSHFGAPAIGLKPWVLAIDGGVRTAARLSLADLQRHPRRLTIPAVLQCAGNGRAFYRPRVPGVGWERGAVGNAEWSGVPLADLLAGCGLEPGFGHVHLVGRDGPPAPKTPAFLRSIPLDRAVDPSTIVATHMNGEPLPLFHGGPLRLVVPGWTGNHWIKWLDRIVVARDEAPGFYQQTGYRMPRTPAPPGATLKPEDLEPVTWMNVKSLFARPADGAKLRPGPQTITGPAWTGRGTVDRVEVEIDGTWRLAELLTPARPGAWRLWRLTWDAPPGRHTLRLRATDSLGQTQPETTPWNRSGYLWNSIERLECEVLPHA